MPESLNRVNGVRGQGYARLAALRFEGSYEFSKTSLRETGGRACP